MKTHDFLLLTVIGIASLGVGSSAQAPQTKGSPAPYKAPRNAFGQPDLEGTWTNNSLTPLQRPAAWANKTTLTPDEVEMLKKATAKLEENGDALFGDELVIDTIEGKGKAASHDTETGNYNGFWLPRTRRRQPHVAHHRPARRPASSYDARVTGSPESSGRAAGAAPSRRSRESRPGRAVHYVRRPRLTAAYSSVFEVVQSPDTFVFTMETIHDARVIRSAMSHLCPRRCHSGSATRAATGRATRSWSRRGASPRRRA